MFIKELTSAFQRLVLKLIASRKALFQIISKILTIHLILSLESELYIVITFGISSIADFVYFGLIEFEKVKTEVRVGK
jgi:hypothetical protein